MTEPLSNPDTLRNAEVDEEGDNLLDPADFYCNAATEALRAGDPSLASARAQIAISINLARLVETLDSVIYDRGDGHCYLRVENELLPDKPYPQDFISTLPPADRKRCAHCMQEFEYVLTDVRPGTMCHDCFVGYHVGLPETCTMCIAPSAKAELHG